MKKTTMLLFLMIASVLTSVAIAQDPLEDRIALSREGGTTRGMGINSRTFGINSMQAFQIKADPVVEAYSSNNVVSISVENYRGSALVEIIGARGSKQAFFQIYDMGFEVISLSGLPAGEYTIRVTLGADVFTGKLKKGMYGR